MEIHMEASEVARAVMAATSTVSSLGLEVDDSVVLHNSNKLTLRLLPCDVVARVAPAAQQVAQFEVDLAQRLAATGSPVAALEPRVEPRVYERDGFAITLWTYYEPVRLERSRRPSTPTRCNGCTPACARSISRRRTSPIESPRPSNSSRTATTLRRSPTRTESCSRDTLRGLRREILDRGAAEQLLHGEPHPGNVLSTDERARCSSTSRRAAGGQSSSTSRMRPKRSATTIRASISDLLRECRILVLAMITAWRWDRDDQFPNGRQLADEWLGQLRVALGP